MGKGVFPKNYWLLAAILILCGVAVETSAQKAEKRAVLPDTEDASQFVMLADAVPMLSLKSAILEPITSWVHVSTAIWSRQPS
jgi:hypothetical protein